MKNDKGAPILTERITGETMEEVEHRFRTWAKEQGNGIEMLEQRSAEWKEQPYWMEIDYYRIPLKRVKTLPLKTVQTFQGDEIVGEVALWRSGENVCEYAGDASGGVCDTAGFYYGTPAEDEPKYCARHFYRNAVFGVDKQDRLIVG